MDERVWEKTAQFLKELRCEDTGRLSQLQLPEYQKAMKEKFSYQPIYEQTVCEMTDEQKCVIEKYVGLTEQCAEEENQQAYLQGMVDMLLLLSGANSHFPRPPRPHFPASQGHIKRSALEIGRARGAPPC